MKPELDQLNVKQFSIIDNSLIVIDEHERGYCYEIKIKAKLKDGKLEFSYKVVG